MVGMSEWLDKADVGIDERRVYFDLHVTLFTFYGRPESLPRAKTLIKSNRTENPDFHRRMFL